MAKRKTIPVSELIDMVNYMCKNSQSDRSEVRQGAMNVLESVLHSTGNYKGFRYLLAGECSGAPGVNYQGSVPHPDIKLRFEGTDRTRVEYFD
jgi:hypothetical protein